LRLIVYSYFSYASFGSILYEILTKHAPYGGSNASSGLLRELIVGKSKPDLELLNEVKKRLTSKNDLYLFEVMEGVMTRCWDLDPNSRLSSADGM